MRIIVGLVGRLYWVDVWAYNRLHVGLDVEVLDSRGWGVAFVVYGDQIHALAAPLGRGVYVELHLGRSRLHFPDSSVVVGPGVHGQAVLGIADDGLWLGLIQELTSPAVSPLWSSVYCVSDYLRSSKLRFYYLNCSSFQFYYLNSSNFQFYCLNSSSFHFNYSNSSKFYFNYLSSSNFHSARCEF